MINPFGRVLTIARAPSDERKEFLDPTRYLVERRRWVRRQNLAQWIKGDREELVWKYRQHIQEEILHKTWSVAQQSIRAPQENEKCTMKNEKVSRPVAVTPTCLSFDEACPAADSQAVVENEKCTIKNEKLMQPITASHPPVTPTSSSTSSSSSSSSSSSVTPEEVVQQASSSSSSSSEKKERKKAPTVKRADRRRAYREPARSFVSKQQLERRKSYTHRIQKDRQAVLSKRFGAEKNEKLSQLVAQAHAAYELYSAAQPQKAAATVVIQQFDPTTEAVVVAAASKKEVEESASVDVSSIQQWTDEQIRERRAQIAKMNLFEGAESFYHDLDEVKSDVRAMISAVTSDTDIKTFVGKKLKEQAKELKASEEFQLQMSVMLCMVGTLAIHMQAAKAANKAARKIVQVD